MPEPVSYDDLARKKSKLQEIAAWQEEMLNRTGLPEKAQQVGEWLGSPLPREYQQQVGSFFQGLPLMATDLAISAGAGAITEGAGAIPTFAGLQAAHAYGRTGDPTSAAISGAVNLAAPYLGKAAGQAVLGRMGAPLASELTQGVEGLVGSEGASTLASQLGDQRVASTLGQWLGEKTAEQAGYISPMIGEGMIERGRAGEPILPSGPELFGAGLSALPFVGLDAIHSGMGQSASRFQDNVLTGAREQFRTDYVDAYSRLTGGAPDPKQVDAAVVQAEGGPTQSFQSSVRDVMQLKELRGADRNLDYESAVKDLTQMMNLPSSIKVDEKALRYSLEANKTDSAGRPRTMDEILFHTSNQMRARATQDAEWMNRIDPAYLEAEQAAQVRDRNAQVELGNDAIFEQAKTDPEMAKRLALTSGSRRQMLEAGLPARMSIIDRKRGYQWLKSLTKNPKKLSDLDVESGIKVFEDGSEQEIAQVEQAVKDDRYDVIREIANRVQARSLGNAPDALESQAGAEGASIERALAEGKPTIDTQLSKFKQLTPEATAQAQRFAAQWQDKIDWSNPEEVQKFENAVREQITIAERGFSAKLKGEKVIKNFGSGPEAQSQAAAMRDELESGTSNLEGKTYAVKKVNGNYIVNEKTWFRQEKLRDEGQLKATQEFEQFESGVEQSLFDAEKEDFDSAHEQIVGTKAPDTVDRSLDETFEGARQLVRPGHREAAMTILFENLTKAVNAIDLPSLEKIAKRGQALAGLQETKRVQTAKLQAQYIAYVRFLRDGGNAKLAVSRKRPERTIGVFKNKEDAGAFAATRPSSTVREETFTEDSVKIPPGEISGTTDDPRTARLLDQHPEGTTAYLVVRTTKGEQKVRSVSTEATDADLAMLNNYLNELGVGYTRVRDLRDPRNAFFQKMVLLNELVKKQFQVPGDYIQRPVGDFGFHNQFVDPLTRQPLPRSQWPKAVMNNTPTTWGAPSASLRPGVTKWTDRNGVEHTSKNLESVTWIDKNGKKQVLAQGITEVAPGPDGKKKTWSGGFVLPKLFDTLYRNEGTTDIKTIGGLFLRMEDVIRPEDAAWLKILLNKDGKRLYTPDIPVGVAVTKDASVRGLYSMFGTTGRHGAILFSPFDYHPGTGKLTLLDPADAAEHFVHEVLHAHSSIVLARDADLRKAVEDVAQIAQENYNHHQFYSQSLQMGDSPKRVDEFWVEFGTNRDLRKLLMTLPDTLGPNPFSPTLTPYRTLFDRLWDVFKEAISRLFGISTPERATLFNRMEKLMATTFERQDLLTPETERRAGSPYDIERQKIWSQVEGDVDERRAIGSQEPLRPTGNKQLPGRSAGKYIPGEEATQALKYSAEVGPPEQVGSPATEGRWQKPPLYNEKPEPFRPDIVEQPTSSKFSGRSLTDQPVYSKERQGQDVLSDLQSFESRKIDNQTEEDVANRIARQFLDAAEAHQKHKHPSNKDWKRMTLVGQEKYQVDSYRQEVLVGDNDKGSPFHSHIALTNSQAARDRIEKMLPTEVRRELTRNGYKYPNFYREVFNQEPPPKPDYGLQSFESRAPSPREFLPQTVSGYATLSKLYQHAGFTPVESESMAASMMRLLVRFKHPGVFNVGKMTEEALTAYGRNADGLAERDRKVVGIAPRTEGARKLFDVAAIKHVLAHEMFHLVGERPLMDAVQNLSDENLVEILKVARDAATPEGAKTAIEPAYNPQKHGRQEFAAEFAAYMSSAFDTLDNPSPWAKDVMMFTSPEVSDWFKDLTSQQIATVDRFMKYMDQAMPNATDAVVEGTQAALVALKKLVRPVKEIEELEAQGHELRLTYPDMFEEQVQRQNRVTSAIGRGYISSFESRARPPEQKWIRQQIGLAENKDLSFWEKNFANFLGVVERYPVLRPIWDAMNVASRLAKSRFVAIQEAQAGAWKGGRLVSDARSAEIRRFYLSPRMQEAFTNITLEQNIFAQANGRGFNASEMEQRLKKYLPKQDEQRIVKNTLDNTFNQLQETGSIIVQAHRAEANTVMATALRRMTNRTLSVEQSRKVAEALFRATNEADPMAAQDIYNREVVPFVTKPDVLAKVTQKAGEWSQIMKEEEVRVRSGIGSWTSERRFGNFSVKYKNPDGSISTRYFKNKRERDTFAEKSDVVSLNNRESGGDGNYGLNDEAYEVLRQYDAKQNQLLADLIGEADARKQGLWRESESELRTALAAQDATNTRLKRTFAKSREHLSMFDVQQDYMQAVINASKNKQMRLETALHLTDEAFDLQPELKNLVKSHVENVLKPDTEWGRRIATANFTYWLGGNLSTMILEPFQQLMSLAPVLTMHHKVGIAEPYKYISKANTAWLRSRLTGKFGDPELDSAMERWRREGVADAGIYQELDFNQDLSLVNRIRSAGGLNNYNLFDLVKNRLYAVANLARRFYSIVPSYNSEIALIASYKLARAKGMTAEQAFEHAAYLKDVSMFGGGKLNRPVGLFSGVNRTMAQAMYSLQSYNTSMLTMMGQLIKESLPGRGLTPAQRWQSRKALAQMTGTMFAAGGALGMPFVAAGISILQKLFPGYNVEQEVREAITNWTKDDDGTMGLLGDFLLKGLPNTIKNGPDLSSRFAIGGVLGMSPYNGFEIANLFGPTTSIIQNAIKAGQAAFNGDVPQAVEDILPVSMKHLWQAGSQGSEYRNQKGNLLLDDLSPTEQVFRAAGFTPGRAANAKDVNRLGSQAESSAKFNQERTADKLAQLYLEGDLEGVREAFQDYREENPQVNPQALLEALSKRVEDQSFLQDPRMRGSSLSQRERERLFRSGNLDTLPSMRDRWMLRQKIAGELGLPYTKPPGVSALKQATVLDFLQQMNPYASTAELRSQASPQPWQTLP